MKNRIPILTAAATLALLTAAVPARAQQFNGWLSAGQTGYSNDYRTSYADARRAAYDNGYREGLRHGEEAARDRKPFQVEREKDYRKADEGYNRSYGDKDRYRDMFRSGFADGYREAYNRYGYNDGGYGRAAPRRDGAYGYPAPYPQYPNNAPRTYPNTYPNTYPGDGGYGGYGTYGNVAFQNGVNDGYQKGLEDARDRKYPDVTRQKWYRNGDHNYDNRYGSKDLYRDDYRRGFQQGYQRAYSGSAGRPRGR